MLSGTCQDVEQLEQELKALDLEVQQRKGLQVTGAAMPVLMEVVVVVANVVTGAGCWGYSWWLERRTGTH